MNTTDAHSTLRWGIIGCGDVTEVKSGPAFRKIPGSALTAVMRRNGDLARDYAHRHGVPRWYDNADALIQDPEVDAVYVATPPDTHELYAISSIAAGKPVYVEKPMSVSLEACRRMKAAAEQAGVKLSIAHYRRGLSMFRQIKQWIHDGVIGTVRTARISLLQPDRSNVVAQTKENWRLNPAVAGAGLFYDLAPHQLDLLIWMLGAPQSAKGFSVNQAGLYTADDAVAGVLELPGKILFTGQWCFTVHETVREDLFEITGSAGSIRFPVFGNTVSLLSNGKTETHVFTHPEHIQQPMIEQVIQYFTGKVENPCSADDAMLSMQIMETFAYGEKNKQS
jgi:predicted dehydrogenase